MPVCAMSRYRNHPVFIYKMLEALEINLSRPWSRLTIRVGPSPVDIQMKKSPSTPGNQWHGGPRKLIHQRVTWGNRGWSVFLVETDICPFNGKTSPFVSGALLVRCLQLKYGMNIHPFHFHIPPNDIKLVPSHPFLHPALYNKFKCRNHTSLETDPPHIIDNREITQFWFVLTACYNIINLQELLDFSFLFYIQNITYKSLFIA